MQQVRIKFEKVGLSKYISHLDLMRCMSRAIKRAGIPLWYTEGFNKHPYMTFALPLSLGIESICETMDIRVEGEMTKQDVFDKLSSALPVGINIISVEDSKMKANVIACAEYDILFLMDKELRDNFYFSANALLAQEELIAEKMGKKGRKKVLKQINLIEHIKKYTIQKTDDGVMINAVISAGNTVNVNPSLLVDVLKKEIGTEIDVVRITRKNLYTSDGELFE